MLRSEGEGFQFFLFRVLPAFLAAGLVMAACSVTADGMQIKSGLLDYQADIIEISEGVTVYWEDYQVDSLRGEIDRENEIATFFTDVVLTFAEGTSAGEELTVYLQEERFIFTDDVLLEYRSDPEADLLELKADRLEMFGETGNFEARGSVDIDYRGRKISADEGDYEEEDEIFYMRHNVRLEEEDGDWITADRAQVHLGEEDIFRAEGNVEIELGL